MGHAAAAIGTAGLLAVLAAAVWSVTPLRARTQQVATAPSMLSRFDYLAHDARSGHVDHYELFHGLGDLDERLRDADVLFLGNSRLMFAMPPRLIRPFFRARGLHHYVMGFGHVEANVFAEAVIERLDLRPSLVIVNADGTFFTDTTSDWGQVVMTSSRFDALKYRWEARATHAVRRVLHRYVPHALELYRNEPEIIIYRSSLDGTWDVQWASYVDFGARVPPDPGGLDALDPRTIAIARSFQAEVAARGARLLLMSVPAPDVSPGHARALAAALDVPLLAPPIEELRHFDGSHLIPSSAQRYASGLLDDLDEVLQLSPPEAGP